MPNTQDDEVRTSKNIEYQIPIESLNQAEYNPRKISDDALARLKQSISSHTYSLKNWDSKNGYRLVDPIIVNSVNNRIIGGHQRVKALIGLNQSWIHKDDIRYVKIENERKEAALNIALNNQQAAGEWDFPMLKDIIADIDLGDFNIEHFTGFTYDDMHTMFDYVPSDMESNNNDEEYTHEPPKKPKTKLGDLYELGRHRLLCGDCTKKEDVERLMDRERAEVSITDPPYNVDVNYGEYDDSKSVQEYRKFSQRWFELARQMAEVLVFTPGTGRNLVNYDMWWSIERPYWQAIWTKLNSMTHSPIGGFQNYEPIFIYGKPGKRIGQDVFDCPVTVQHDVEDSKGNKLHPTPKQVKLWKMLIDAFSDTDNTIYEPFGGSGTTIIACEQIMRKCRMMEIDPHYCDVIVERWCKYTGIYDIKLNGKLIKWSSLDANSEEPTREGRGVS